MVVVHVVVNVYRAQRRYLVHQRNPSLHVPSALRRNVNIMMTMGQAGSITAAGVPRTCVKIAVVISFLVMNAFSPLVISK